MKKLGLLLGAITLGVVGLTGCSKEITAEEGAAWATENGYTKTSEIDYTGWAETNGYTKTGEAYGLAHGGSYVAKATVTMKGSKAVDATLVEVCFPTQVTAEEAVPAADKVAVTTTKNSVTTTNYYYKTVKFAGHTFVYDATDGYKEGSTKLKDFFATEANCKAYYEAVIDNNIAVVYGEAEHKDVLTVNTLSKERNGYWTKQDTYGKDYSRWMLNRDATIKYFLENGIDVCKAATKATKTAPWGTADAVSGATWTDFNKEGATGYLTYVQLLEAAQNNASK